MERLEEAGRWFKQALRDLKAAKDNLNAENYEWACFQSQQSAEKAVKAVAFASAAISACESIAGWAKARLEEKGLRVQS